MHWLIDIFILMEYRLNIDTISRETDSYKTFDFFLNPVKCIFVYHYGNGIMNKYV